MCRQLIADAVDRLRSRQGTSDGNIIIEEDTKQSPPPSLEHQQNEHSTDIADSKTIGTTEKNSNTKQDNTSETTNDHTLNRPDLREWPACQAVNFHFPIKAALTEDGHWKYIVNNENYMQVVTGSICT